MIVRGPLAAIGGRSRGAGRRRRRSRAAAVRRRDRCRPLLAPSAPGPRSRRCARRSGPADAGGPRRSCGARLRSRRAVRRAAPPRRRRASSSAPGREPRVDGGELRPRGARLLDDPVVLAGGAAEAVEPGERLLERSAPSRTASGSPGRPARRARGRAPRAATRRRDGLVGDRRAASRSRPGPARPRVRRAASGAEVASCPRELALERVELERRGAALAPRAPPFPLRSSVGLADAGRSRRRRARSERPPAGRNPSRRPRGAPRPSSNASARGADRSKFGRRAVGVCDSCRIGESCAFLAQLRRCAVRRAC